MATGIKTGGRQAGTPNKVTGRAKQLIAELVEMELSRLPETMEKLTDIERLQVLVKLLPYVVTKAESTQQENSDMLIKVIRQGITSRIIE